MEPTRPLGYRWATNLEAYDASETDRFVGYYRQSAADSAVVLAQDEFPAGG